MMAIYWRELYDINIPAVNNERRLFFSILNQVENENFLRQRELVEKFLKELLNKSQDVFKQEERLFVLNRCPDELVANQIKEHGEFLDELERVSRDGFTSAIEFVNVLKTFIINHIIGTDLECAAFVKYSFVNNFIGFQSFDTILTDLVDRKPLINWTSYFEVGIHEVDKQHSSFIDVINDLVLNYNIYTSNTVTAILDGLVVYADIHFRTEEAYMNKVKEYYPEYEKHKREHKEFTEYLRNEVDNFLGAENNTFKENEALLKKLIEWLGKHIIGTDKKFAKIYHEHKKEA